MTRSQQIARDRIEAAVAQMVQAREVTDPLASLFLEQVNSRMEFVQDALERIGDILLAKELHGLRVYPAPKGVRQRMVKSSVRHFLNSAEGYGFRTLVETCFEHELQREQLLRYLSGEVAVQSPLP